MGDRHDMGSDPVRGLIPAGPETHIVGLTGGIGSGKSTVARLFGELGVHWVDADDVARQVVEPGTHALKAITEHFGPEVLQADGSLNRAWLRQRIFEAPGEKEWLEALLHPIIRKELMNQLLYPLSPSPLPPGERGYTTLGANIPSPLAGEGQGEGRKSTYDLPYVLLISPLLLETDQHELVEKVVVVDVPESVQLERTMARDDNSRQQVERIMAAQMARDERCARADAIINNNNPLADVRRQVRKCHDRFVQEFVKTPGKESGG